MLFTFNLPTTPSLSNVELAKKFNVAEGLISAVQLGKVYKNVNGQIRKFRRCKYTQRLPDEIHAQIRSEYIPCSTGLWTNHFNRMRIEAKRTNAIARRRELRRRGLYN